MRGMGDNTSGETGVPARLPNWTGGTPVAPPYELISGAADESLAARPLQLKSRRASRTQTLHQRRSRAESRSAHGLVPPVSTQLRAEGDGARSTPSETCKTV